MADFVYAVQRAPQNPILNSIFSARLSHPYDVQQVPFAQQAGKSAVQPESSPTGSSSEVMADAKNDEPVVSLFLDGQVGFQLNRKAFSRKMNMKTQMRERNKPVTLVLDGYSEDKKGIDIPTLRRGLLELFDAETKRQISIPTSDEAAGSLVIPAASPNQLFDPTLDSFDPFWNGLLKPGRNYEILWSANGGHSWCYYGQPEESFENFTRLPVRRLTRSIKLIVHDDASAPP
jgi:hypothetical protein